MFKDYQILIKLISFLVDKIKNKLREQKHVATGKGIESVQGEIIEHILAPEIIINSEHYLSWVNTGRKSGTKKVPINALLAWMKVIGITASQSKSEKSIAFAIQQSIYQKGIPSQPYVMWSGGNIKREGFLDDFIDENEAHIINEIEEFAGINAETILENQTRKWT